MDRKEYKTVRLDQAKKLLESGEWHIHFSAGNYITLFRTVVVQVFEEFGPEHTKHISA